MANQKNFYYVGIQTERGMQFVTDIDYRTKTAKWQIDKKPLAMSKKRAEDLRFCLCLNFHFAVIVNCHFEMDQQYFAINKDKDNENNNIPFTPTEIELLKVAISYYYIVCTDEQLEERADKCFKLYLKLFEID